MMKTKAEVWIPLTQGKVAVIDFEDFEKARPYKWCLHKGRGQVLYGFARKNTAEGRDHMKLHRLVWGEESIPPGFEIGHKDGDGLNCRRENLQCLTHAQNLQGRCSKRGGTTSKYRGVSWHKRDLCWHAQINVNYKVRHIGNFADETKAARAYDAAAIKYFGEFAALNFPDQKNQCQSLIRAGGVA